VESYIKEEDFCFTYGDGLSNLDIGASIIFHRNHGKLATVTAVQPPGRYGALERSGDQVTGFIEKPRGDGGLINGGFFILSPKCLSLIEGDPSSWEGEPLSKLAKMNELMAFEHHGFWQPMDTLRDKMLLEDLWTSGKAPWKVW
jgi:glucose-1-phosphate cytidylyltransferase